MRAISKVLAISGVGLTSLLLVSCGGGGSDSGGSNIISQLDPKASQAYTGSRDPVLLNESNALLFASLIVGNSASGEALSRPQGTSKSILTNQPQLIDGLLKVTENRSINTDFQSRAVSESEACEYGGTVSGNGDIDPETEVGFLVLTFKDCKLDSDSTLNGQASQTTHADESVTLAYQDLTVSQGGESYSITGVVTNNEIERVSNLTSINTLTGLSTYLQNYTIESNRYDLESPNAINGKVYISNLGYVTISTSDDYSTYSDYGVFIPSNGEILLTGAAVSKARIVDSGEGNYDNGYSSESKYTVGLDANGDGVYELTAIQDQTSSEPTDLEENTAPTSVLVATHYNLIDGNTDHDDTAEYTIGTELQLFSDNSYDNDDTELQTVWTIEEYPEGSSATVVNHEDTHDYIYGYINQQASFTPDVQGTYKISLKVTDYLGSGQSSISFITINIANATPSISQLEDYIYDDKAAGSTFSVGIASSDRDTFTEDPGVIISYEWIEKPNGSAAELLIEQEYVFAEVDFGFNINIWYSFIGDEAGTYKLRFRATDAEGAFSEEVVEVNVRSTELTAEDFQCHGYLCDWDNRTTTTNELMSLDITDNNFSSCKWQLLSVSPEHSFVPEIFQGYDTSTLSFTATQTGEYDLSVTCDSAYSSAQTQFNTSLYIN
ncbi:hypothetical protein [Leucothrix arctica]|uniref:Uncharacterized protein n=1 Tax=Leucothrix arctica TaxID=1481894 RepID=A0A317CDI5_9GAMM|nr:hypothetical protein [Leucothrix arctica]PWQ96745.1 hypothetical protein DKT75_08215 [Leucothrix arctica]